MIEEVEQEATSAEVLKGSDGPESEASKALSLASGGEQITITWTINKW